MNVAAAVKWIVETNVSPSRRCSGVCPTAGPGRAVGHRATSSAARPARMLSVLSRLISATLYVIRNTAIAHSVPTKSSRTPE